MADEKKEKNDVVILGIESSCDETAAAVVVNGQTVLSNVIYSQVPTHTLYGGVVPEIASREHVAKINQVIRKAMSDAAKTWDDLDAIAVTYGPGLVGPLLVGVGEAKALAYARQIPLVGVNHIEGHISANYIREDLSPDVSEKTRQALQEKNEQDARIDGGFCPPFMCLVASGGHSHIVLVEDYAKYRIIGRTHDDAAGEAFDKVARAIGLGYPGGPKIDRLVREEKGNPHGIEFPRASVSGAPYDFSFSGLKSAVLNYLNGCAMKGIPVNRADVAASFQQAVVDVLTDHTIRAAKDFGCRRVALAGGVAANTLLRETMRQRGAAEGLSFTCPPLIYCTDNGAMIGAAGYYDFIRGIRSGNDLNANPNLQIGER